MKLAKLSILAAWGRALVDFLSVAPAVSGAAGVALIVFFLSPLGWHLRLTLVLITLASLVIYCAQRTKNEASRPARMGGGTVLGMAPGDLGIVIIALVFTVGGLYLATMSFHVPPALIARLSALEQTSPPAHHAAAPESAQPGEVSVSIAPTRPRK